jgi:hypothetical protein
MSNFVIVSYYTLNTKYQEISHQFLMPTLLKLGLKSDIRGVFSLGSWQKNTSYKPSFIKTMLETHPNENIVFVDVDAEILKHPELFNNIPDEYNIAVHILDKNKWYNNSYGEDRYELLSGTLFLRNNRDTMEMVTEWAKQCENSNIWEQKVLQNLITNKKVKLYELPLEYAYISTLPNGNLPHIKVDSPVIIHHQASRKLKNLVT